MAIKYINFMREQLVHFLRRLSHAPGQNGRLGHGSTDNELLPKALGPCVWGV